MTQMEDILKALNNEENEQILNKTSEQIHIEKYNIINELSITESQTNELLNKLNDYMYIDEIPDIKYGSFVRWINLENNDNIKLTNGGVVCDVDICNNGVIIKCKNFRHQIFTFLLSKSLIFRKLSNQEKVLLSVSDYLSK